jgi:hypothetical protein
VPALDDRVAQALAIAYRQVPNPLSELHLHHLGGALGRVPAEATAFATLDRDFVVNVIARTPTAEGFDGAVVGPRRHRRAGNGPGLRQLHR